MVLGLGSGFLVYYVYSYWQLHKRGYQVSFSQGLSAGQHRPVLDLYLGLQQLWRGLLHYELLPRSAVFQPRLVLRKNNMMKLFRLQNLRWGKYLAAALFIGLGGTYGYWVEALDTDIEWLWAITMVVSVMHFWYDGFVWSVRKHQV